ncbi:unnamed protein product [Paramecium pentaurelia]|uniref:E3 ubiquitin-protein ligase CHFR n=1 Tax=Paramecium pentaurelia TaxID=43138 RepID=A0A8S1V7P7_9CILI|nr:unnamed protein product [Paramecium pentaurelia]
MFAKLLSLNTNTSSSIEISKPIFSIGRDQKNDKVFSDIKVSANHLTIEYKDSQFTVTDYSSNGTYINENKIGKGNTVTILNGDKIHLLPIQKVKDHEVIGFEFVVCINTEQQASKLSIESIDRQVSDGKREVKNENILNTKLVENQVESQIINEPSKQKKEQSPPPVPKIDGLEDELQCTICNDYLFEAVAANPCNHHFCGSCLSNWFKKQTYECPNCRSKLTGVMQARTINNLVEKWLKINPHEKRTEQLLNKMKEENLIYKNPQEYINLSAKFNQDQQQKKIQLNRNFEDEQDIYSDEENDEENQEENDENDSNDDDEYLSNDDNFDDNKQNQQIQQQQQYIPLQFQNNGFQGFNNLFPQNNLNGLFPQNHFQLAHGQNLFQQQFIQQNKVCKSCNGKIWKNFQCPPQQQHVGCASCARLMPKLDPSDDDNEVLQMQCCICKAYHCTFYYGDCNNAALQKFMLVKNIQHQMVIPYNYVNSTEYNRLLKHLGGRPQTVIFNFMMDNYISKGYFYFQQNKLTFNNPIQEINVKISQNSPICWLCHRKLINFIIFRYVQCMKYDEPLFMREDCYYGINCRLQQQNQVHAQKYNHFCEQTKFD